MTGTAPASPATDPGDPGAALTRRFGRELARLWPEGARPGGGRLGLAVSGGPDSLALLLLCEAALPGRFEVASVDHGLRAESAAECAMVRELCAARDIPCAILPVRVGRGNVQSRARAARYAALAEWAARAGLSAIATAHHADDQAETLLMRLNRGSGAAGLAGVRGRGAIAGGTVPLVRPLLPFRRAELAGLVRAAGLAAADDPSNRDDRFDRVRIRRALADADWLDIAGLSVSAAHLADADEALDWAAHREWNERVVLTATEIRYRPLAPRAIMLRVLERAIAHFGGTPRGQSLARLAAKLERGESGNLAGVLARADGDGWRLTPEPPRRTGGKARD